MVSKKKSRDLPSRDQALPGRQQEMAPTTPTHYVNGRSLVEPWPEHSALAMFGMGCFWGAERKFWQAEGVWVTAVGYSGGRRANANYAEVCSGLTGHNEVVRVVYDPSGISYESLLRIFWEGHDPTQYMRQGNDVGTQYRSGIYTYSEQQQESAEHSRERYQVRLAADGYGDITTEIISAPEFYYAESAHQQYLAKNPSGYCGLGGTGVVCP